MDLKTQNQQICKNLDLLKPKRSLIDIAETWAYDREIVPNDNDVDKIRKKFESIPGNFHEQWQVLTFEGVSYLATNGSWTTHLLQNDFKNIIEKLKLKKHGWGIVDLFIQDDGSVYIRSDISSIAKTHHQPLEKTKHFICFEYNKSREGLVIFVSFQKHQHLVLVETADNDDKDNDDKDQRMFIFDPWGGSKINNMTESRHRKITKVIQDTWKDIGLKEPTVVAGTCIRMGIQGMLRDVEMGWCSIYPVLFLDLCLNQGICQHPFNVIKKAAESSVVQDKKYNQHEQINRRVADFIIHWLFEFLGPIDPGKKTTIKQELKDKNSPIGQQVFEDAHVLTKRESNQKWVDRNDWWVIHKNQEIWFFYQKEFFPKWAKTLDWSPWLPDRYQLWVQTSQHFIWQVKLDIFKNGETSMPEGFVQVSEEPAPVIVEGQDKKPWWRNLHALKWTGTDQKIGLHFDTHRVVLTGDRPYRCAVGVNPHPIRWKDTLSDEAHTVRSDVEFFKNHMIPTNLPTLKNIQPEVIDETVLKMLEKHRYIVLRFPTLDEKKSDAHLPIHQWKNDGVAAWFIADRKQMAICFWTDGGVYTMYSTPKSGELEAKIKKVIKPWWTTRQMTLDESSIVAFHLALTSKRDKPWRSFIEECDKNLWGSRSENRECADRVKRWGQQLIQEYNPS